MKKIGKISAVKREYNSTQLKTMQSELANRGYTRMPGTGVFKYPYREFDGRYRTGLDPDAAYIQRIQDPLQKELEIKRVTDLKNRLTKLLQLDLSPTSKFWNHALASSNDDTTHAQPVKLLDGENVYDLSIPWQELTFAWLRVHPTIASSYEAWKAGRFPADTQFYVADEEIETALAYKKKTLINKAIAKFDGMTPSKRRKIARVMGLPVTEDSKEESVYNQVDTLLKETEFKTGKYKGKSPVKVFTDFADMEENLLHVKDLVKQAITHSIYRVKANGKVYQGEAEIAKDEDELVKYLIDENNQSDVLTLEQDLKGKKMAMI